MGFQSIKSGMVFLGAWQGLEKSLMPRPMKEGEKLDRILSVRVSFEDTLLIKRIKNSEGISIGEWIRDRIHAYELERKRELSP